MEKNIINYSQCWEDSEILIKALNISAHDVVLSITSGGDNTIALLLCGPRRITAIDLNCAQNHLLELKLASAKALSYDDYLSFLGLTDSFNRLYLFPKLKPYLSPKAYSWWLRHKSAIKKGIINSGRFERFLNLFRKYILPLVHSRRKTAQFVTIPSIEKQREFYKNRWDTKKWRIYFRLATSRPILKYLARQPGMFNYVGMKKISDKYLKRLESNIKNVPIVSNYFLHYCLTGNFGTSLPLYLKKDNYFVIKKYKFPLSIITENILNHLKSMPENSYTKYNLSDIFEALSDDETNILWEEIIRTSKNGATIVYWDNLLSKSIPSAFSDKVKDKKQLEKKLFLGDRVFFYGNFHIYKVIK